MAPPAQISRNSLERRTDTMIQAAPVGRTCLSPGDVIALKCIKRGLYRDTRHATTDEKGVLLLFQYRL